MKIPFLIRSLFILNILICLLRLESGLCAVADHSSTATKAVIELVVPENPSCSLTIYSFPSANGQSPEYSCDNAALSYNNYASVDYDAFVLQLIKSSNLIRNHSIQLVSILQKCSIWHQSSDDSPPRIS
jgi:hypothetical protein